MKRKIFLLVLSLFSFELSVAQKEGVCLRIFIAPDCPISIKYIPTLKELHANYSEKIRIDYYFPKEYTKAEAREFESQYAFPASIRIDKENKVIKELSISTTPEVYLIKDETIVYRGAIDNWFYALGKNRIEPSIHYLANALDALLEEKLPQIEKTRPVGCLISL